MFGKAWVGRDFIASRTALSSSKNILLRSVQSAKLVSLQSRGEMLSSGGSSVFAVPAVPHSPRGELSPSASASALGSYYSQTPLKMRENDAQRAANSARLSAALLQVPLPDHPVCTCTTLGTTLYIFCRLRISIHWETGLVDV